MKAGHYELKHKKHTILSWSHGTRLKLAVRLAKRLPGRRLLDFGSGDGVFEKMLAQDPAWNGTIVAADLEPTQIEECQKRLSDLPNTSFITLPELTRQPLFETIVCMEVLEHVVEIEALLDYLSQLLEPGGNLIISVPVETGLVLLAKQVIRFRLGGDYRYTERYSASEFWSAFLPTNKKHNRPSYETNPDSRHHGHKLFNWRWLRSVLRRKFTIERELATPLPILASQRWFICKKDR